MSFNLRADSIIDINNRWKNRSKIVYEVIKKYDCDVIGLQEVTDRMFEDIHDNLTAYQIIGEGRSRKYFNERNNIAAKKEYSLSERSTFWLSSTPEKVGSSIWYSLFPRICTTAIVGFNNGINVRIYNTHLDCLLPYAREYGLKKILQYIQEQYEKEKLPCILMGDFNASPKSKLINGLSTGMYNDRHLVAVQDSKKELYNEATMGHFKGKTSGMHIDYIFVSEEFDIKDVEIVRYNQKGKYPSDHYPIVTELGL